jgi:hypothetical protein
MPTSPESRAIAKLAWDAAWERLNNALFPPEGYPKPSSEELAECYWNAQARLDQVRVAFNIQPPRR